MNNKVSYLHGWDSELCFHLHLEGNRVADFNRFLYKHFPATKKLQQGDQFEDADRESFVHQIKACFYEKIKEGSSHSTLYTQYLNLSLYLRWCDLNNAITFTQESLEGYMSHLHTRVMQRTLKRSSYQQYHSNLLVLFRDYLDLPSSYFDSITIMYNNDTESFEAYTRTVI